MSVCLEQKQKGLCMEENWNTHQTLILRAQNPDDASAWDDFVKYYETFIKMVLKKSNIPFSEADDLVQDILLKVWKGLPGYEYRREKAKFRTWLGTIIRNTVINHYKKVKRTGGGKFEIFENSILNIKESEIEKVIKDEWIKYLTKFAMDKIESIFSGQAIEVFKLSLKGNSGRDIATALSITEESVFVLRSRVKSRLKKEIDSLRSEIEFT
ncbi:MAG: sigma-70 family RNA polymerase sigma factor [Lentisphaerales bacterium]|nr:sigma-70 family RNA polymerase sigma factor [Lentisphaerales bacterium]